MLRSAAANLRRRWRRYSVELIVILGLVLAVQAWNARGAVLGPAPPLAGMSLDGRPLDVRAPGGESVLVHFWATWCHICPLMDGNIEWLADGHRVIGVALRSGGAASVANYMRDEDIAFPTLLDPDGYEAARWGVRGVPATFFVSGDGTVTHVSVGYTSWLGLRIRLWLAGRQTD